MHRYSESFGAVSRGIVRGRERALRLARAGGIALAAAAAAASGAEFDALPNATSMAQPIREYSRDAKLIEPVGVWHCLAYGHREDERFYLALTHDGRARIARISDAIEGRWNAFGEWRRRSGGKLTLNAAENRNFEADLNAESLGGRWTAPLRDGGWWCAEVDDAVPVDPMPPAATGLMAAPVPAIMASPNYPRQAIREAKEGRAVICFIIDGRGDISRPGLIELTDDVFREPTLAAVVRSRYQSRGHEQPAPVPACRSYKYELRLAG